MDQNKKYSINKINLHTKVFIYKSNNLQITYLDITFILKVHLNYSQTVKNLINAPTGRPATPW